MKKVVYFLLVGLFLFTSCATKEIDISKLKIYPISDLDLNQIEFSDENFKNKFVIVYFWATWSEESIKVLDEINEICKKSYNDLTLLVINFDSDREKVKEFLLSNNYLFNTYYDFDGKWTKNYYIRYVPYTLIYDKQGNLLKEYKVSDYDDYVDFQNLVDRKLK